MIEFKNVSIKYTNDFYCLLDYSLAIKKNTLFIGDFYSGTNSIMRIISKIDKHYSGTVNVNNLNIQNIKDKDLSVAYLPQNPVLFKFKNIFNNIYFPLKLRKINKNNAKNTINSIKNEFNLNFLDKKIKNLNICEKKIVCLIRAILWQPEIILLENFFENLDATYTEITRKLLDRFAKPSLIVACEKVLPNVPIFKEFEIVNLEK